MSNKERLKYGLSYNCFSTYFLYSYNFKIKELEKKTPFIYEKGVFFSNNITVEQR